jgi:hypothetical protein
MGVLCWAQPWPAIAKLCKPLPAIKATLEAESEPLPVSGVEEEAYLVDIDDGPFVAQGSATPSSRPGRRRTLGSGTPNGCGARTRAARPSAARPLIWKSQIRQVPSEMQFKVSV